ncbi:ribonuclease J [Murdochiella massiliensis]|uniref:ribonuclease J n=1 Tax=Murdochiella massiliensis TaxID=1673723 RepID=UPI000832A1D9|nr:ribonuclease J [Murdochiella massiliensis]MBY0584386.1 ribonuclease J [Murdochiella sp. Marseille-P8839]
MKTKANIKRLRVIPLGGLREIGKNMAVVEYGNDMIVIDAGLTFPDEDMPGVDTVIPDISYLEKNKEKLRGILLTHGHEDHYGAVPYVLKKLQTNVYCTRLTGGMLENKFKEHGINPSVIKYVKAGDVLRLGALDCEFIRVAHSIPDACAIAVHNPVGTILFTGDFKFDFTPIDHEPTDIHRLAELGEEGVLALYSDSTNVERPGYTLSERSVGETFKQIFSNTKGRLIVATFASNLHRVQQIIEAAEANHRKVALSGRSMLNNVAVASELGYLRVQSKTLIDIKDVEKYKPDEVCLLITGSQGEPMSALSRMSNGSHRQITVGEDDTIILSASMIPGNEKSIGDMINALMLRGCRVVYSSLQNVHVSGHACQEEIKLMHSLVNEEYFIPAHGEPRMLITHKKLAMDLGLPEDHILMAENGSVIEFNRVGKTVVANMDEKVQAGQILIDGLGIGDVGSVVLNDRKRLADDGMISLVVTVDRNTHEVVAGPEIISRGFIYMKDNVDVIEELKKIVIQIFDDAKRRKITDWAFLKSRMREEVKSYVYKEIQRNPMILTIIMETDGHVEQ